MSNTPIAVLYHGGGCADGLCSAWVMRLALKDPSVKFIPVNYSDPVPDLKGYSIRMVDFCFKLEQMVELIEKNISVDVLDHHPTAFPVLMELQGRYMDGRFRYEFSSKHSGARMAWDACFPNESPHWLVNYVEDRDLWAWKLPHSREVSAGIRSYPLTLDSFDIIAQLSTEQMALEGSVVLRKERQIVESHVRHAKPQQIGGFTVPVVNATTLISEIGEALSKDQPFSATYYDDLKNNVRRWSLRSQPDGQNVRSVAERFGGGGHDRAAGFEEQLSS